MTFTGMSAAVDLTPGVALVAFTHGYTNNVGQNDGMPNADETVTISTLFSVGAQSVNVVQDARFQEIINDQFQFNLTASPIVTIDLGAIGLLDITAHSFGTQVREGVMGGGGLFRSTLLLRAPPPAVIPEPSSVVLLSLGVLGLAGCRRFRRPR